MATRKENAVDEFSLNDVLAEISRGKTAPPCFILYGEEEFQLQNALERIIHALIPEAGARDFNLSTIDGEHEDIGYIVDSLITPPLFPGRKVLLVKNTRLFESKNNLPHLIARIREHVGPDPGQAAAEFMQFLALTDLSVDDLLDGGWRRISEEEWQKLLPGVNAAEREAWLPGIIENAVSRKTAPVPKMADETERLDPVLSGGMPEGNHLILTAPVVDRRKKLFKTIASVGRILVFDKIKKENQQQKAVQEMAAPLLAQTGKRISPGAWEALGKKTGFSPRESLGAIEKLIAYAGEKAVIEVADVEAVVGRTKEDVVFSLTEAFSAGNLAGALESLRELLEQGEAPLMIFSMIVREVRLLLQARLLLDSGRLQARDSNMSDYFRFQKSVQPSLNQQAGEIPLDILSQHPFVVYKALMHAGHFKQDELVVLLKMLARVDLELKSTNLPPSLLLERFLFSALSVSATR